MKQIKIGEKIIGKNSPMYIVVEAGCSYEGKIENALRFVEEAAKNGADAIKFQTFKAKNLVTKNSPQWWIPEEQRLGKKQIDLYSQQDKFGFEEYKKISDYCAKLGITFFSTPFDEESVDLLEKLNVPVYKIASTDLTNLPFLEYVAKKGKPIILSVGMGSLEEIKEAVQTILSAGNDQIILLHCIVEYPTPMEHANLNFIKKLQKEFPDFPIGFSDHTIGIVAPVVAAVLGAKVLEKHFTIDKTIRGAPDHYLLSIDPKDLSNLSKDVRAAEASLGDEERVLLEYEKPAYEHGRRRIVANTPIQKGQIIEKNMLACKRNNKGLYPKFIKDIIGKRAKVDLQEDDYIDFDKIEN